MRQSRARRARNGDLVETLNKFSQYGSKGRKSLDEAAVRESIELCREIFRTTLRDAGFDKRKITALLTKFVDAGRRSAPWRPTSGRVPGRPQDGADGNRIKRWLLPSDHKFFASEIDATLVEIRYMLQAMSMGGFPSIRNKELLDSWSWLNNGRRVNQGDYLDPIQLIPIGFRDFFENPRQVTSGHIYPLDRGGKHVPDNTFLTLAISNNLQGRNTVEELLNMMWAIVYRHKSEGDWKPPTAI
jgi:hypothetical protein